MQTHNVAAQNGIFIFCHVFDTCDEPRMRDRHSSAHSVLIFQAYTHVIAIKMAPTALHS